jgi:hypothetical protein
MTIPYVSSLPTLSANYEIAENSRLAISDDHWIMGDLCFQPVVAKSIW